MTFYISRYNHQGLYIRSDVPLLWPLEPLLLNLCCHSNSVIITGSFGCFPCFLTVRCDNTGCDDNNDGDHSALPLVGSKVPKDVFTADQ